MSRAALRLQKHALLAGIALCALLLLGTASAAERLVVGSKKFPESALLGEMLAQALERRGVAVERRFNLGNTSVAFEALKRGSIDVYPEYSGTALGLMGLDRERTPESQAVAVVRRELYDRHALVWGPPLGFDNSYAVAVREDFARKHRLRTLSDLASLSRTAPVRFAVSHEFLGREDGYRALARRYGLVGEPESVEHGISYQLLSGGQSDAIDVYTTEGLIFEHRLVVLGDDAGFFPRYEAAYVFARKLERDPRFLACLTELSGTLDDRVMRALNRSVEVEGVPPARVARDFLARAGTAAEPARLLRKELGFFELLAHDRQAIGGHLVRHLQLTLMAMTLCLLVGLPLGYAATRSGWAASLALGTSGALQTIPSLALLVFAIPIVAALFTPLGLGALVLEGAALFALFLYALLPVVRNTKEGLEGVDPAVVEAARGVGMTERQVLGWVRFPLALPVILAGVRTSFVITVGGATLAAFVGAGGLGVPIITGLSVQNFAEVWTGAVPAAALALGSDGAFGLLQRWLRFRLFGAEA